MPTDGCNGTGPDSKFLGVGFPIAKACEPRDLWFTTPGLLDVYVHQTVSLNASFCPPCLYDCPGLSSVTGQVRHFFYPFLSSLSNVSSAGAPSPTPKTDGAYLDYTGGEPSASEDIELFSLGGSPLGNLEVWVGTEPSEEPLPGGATQRVGGTTALAYSGLFNLEGYAEIVLDPTDAVFSGDLQVTANKTLYFQVLIEIKRPADPGFGDGPIAPPNMGSLFSSSNALAVTFLP